MMEIKKVFAVQHVDVCMFSNGKFKNVVADVNESYQIKPSETYRKEYTLLPTKGETVLMRFFSFFFIFLAAEIRNCLLTNFDFLMRFFSPFI